MVAIRCFHMIAAVAGFLSTRQESLGRMTTFEREVGVGTASLPDPEGIALTFFRYLP